MTASGMLPAIGCWSSAPSACAVCVRETDLVARLGGESSRYS